MVIYGHAGKFELIKGGADIGDIVGGVEFGGDEHDLVGVFGGEAGNHSLPDGGVEGRINPAAAETDNGRSLNANDGGGDVGELASGLVFDGEGDLLANGGFVIF